jgi:2-polyprenyl-6-methoxyphenol hydroxylase-like FAD-dependent oxidoreductase
MPDEMTFDAVVVGGGIAGSSLAGILAKGGLGVAVVEREARYRDRVRGEFTWPWGVSEARRAGLEEVLLKAGRIELPEVHVYEDRALGNVERLDGHAMMSFSHPHLQEVLLNWAEEQGATVLRPAKAIDADWTPRPEVTVRSDDGENVLRTRLVVGADGRQSAVRRWVGAETIVDPEHHRFGGTVMRGLQGSWRVLSDASTPGLGFFWFNQGDDTARMYMRMPLDTLRESRADGGFPEFARVAAQVMPEGVLDNAEAAGPVAFFPNSNIWASQISGRDVVLIGDAAGSADPSWGRGTSLAFRDVRELSELLLADGDWSLAIAEFGRRRAQYYSVIRAYDQWTNLHGAEEGDEADRRRERRDRAKELDPTLGGFRLIELQGPDGLVADEAARRHYFGEDLSD